MPLDSDRIRQALRGVRFPGYRRDIVSFGMVAGVEVEGATVRLTLKVTTKDPAKKAQVLSDAEAACRDAGADEVVIADGATRAPRPKAPPPAAPPAPRPAPKSLEGVRHVVAIASGKGGVGKSTVVVNLGCAIAARGVKVGLLDADVHGPSLPTMLGVHERPVVREDGRIEPVRAGQLRFVSLGLLLEGDAPAIWRGLMVMGAVRQLLEDVAWAPLDLLLVDLPPGTGDAQLTLMQEVALRGGIVVTTPQEVALADVRRGIRMFRETGVPVLGVLENMSGYTCPSCGHAADIFSEGGGRRAADRYGVPFLGALPLDLRVRASGDAGTPFVLSHPSSEAAQAIGRVADALCATLSLQPSPT